jgi:asparagine synthase (glutamine-hydrolysing)
MFHSIESRVPFLTPDLVSFILSLPASYIIDARGMTKSVFREAMRPFVPKEILARTDKVGFSTPEERWLTEQRADWVASTLESADALPLFARSALVEEWQDIRRGRRKYGSHIWRCVNLIQWSSSVQ